MNTEFNWIAYIMGIWVGFLAGVLFYHWVVKKNKKEKVEEPTELPLWCEHTLSCPNHICESMPRECLYDKRK